MLVEESKEPYAVAQRYFVRGVAKQLARVLQTKVIPEKGLGNCFVAMTSRRPGVRGPFRRRRANGWNDIDECESGYTFDGKVGDMMLLVPDDDVGQATPTDNGVVEIEQARGIARRL
jgi:hypothetical protein